MLETFCAAANIKALMRQETIPDALQKLRPLVDSFFGEDIKGVYMTDLLTNSGVNAEHADDRTRDSSNFEKLDERVYEALVSQERWIKTNLPMWSPSRRAIKYDHRTFRGLTFSPYRHEKAAGLIFFQPHESDILVPGIIREILGVPSSDYSPSNPTVHFLLAVQRFQPRPHLVADPFLDFSDFGACIRSAKTSLNLEIIPAVREFYHAIAQAWDDDTYILKSTAKVSGTIDFIS